MKAVTLLCVLIAVVVAQKVNIEFSEDNLIPEGVDYSSAHYFLVGSIGTGQVYTIDPEGNVVQYSNAPQLTSSVGIQVDEERNRIYVCNNQNAIPDNNDVASLVILKLSDGSFIGEVDLTSLGPAGSPKLLNDVTLPDLGGNVYVTDSNNGIVYRVNVINGAAEVFLKSADLAPIDVFLSPTLGVGANGIELWTDYETGEEYLLVTRSGSGQNAALYKVDLQFPSLEPVDLPAVPYPAFDGLVFNRDNGHLFGIADASVIVELETFNGWESARLVNQYALSCEGATTVTVAGGSAFALCNSNFAQNGPYVIEQGDNQVVSFDNSGSAVSVSLAIIMSLALLLV